jgi:hypothetical protein
LLRQPVIEQRDGEGQEKVERYRERERDTTIWGTGKVKIIYLPF